MKKLLIKIIKWYQRAPFSSHTHCRYVPTCSSYAIEALENYGIVYGLYLSVRRVLRCNPLHKAGLDPVPIKKKEREIL